jgi:sugar-specific transcriptional regulator TrmB
LVRLGLTKNEAKALDALVALGPVGAWDVHKYAAMPRNKAYESLEKLASRGMIEVQHGRPTLYRAIGAKLVIDNLLRDYSREANEALSVLERKQEDLPTSHEDNASAWMVKGEQGVSRRLAELIYEAKEDIFAISGYPPKYLLSAKTALKAAAKKGIRTRPVCMIRPLQTYEQISSDGSIIECRTVKATSTVRTKLHVHDEKLLGGFRGMSGFGAMVIIDETTAFDIVDNGKDPKRAVGILFKAPGIPRIQKATVERILAIYTRKL